MEQNKSKLMLGFLLSVLATVALASASYAWLDISRIPFVTDVSLSLITENAAMIAPDVDGSPGEWDTYLDVSAILENMVPLKPVTYAGGQFYKVDYGEDGRPAGLSPISEENVNVTYPDGDTGTPADLQAERDGWMIAIDYWMKTDGVSTNITLQQPVTTVDGEKGAGTYLIGEPVWNEETISHENGGYGAETMVRIGFESVQTDAEGKAMGEKRFVIYEPNADIHPDGTYGVMTTESSQGGSLIDSEHLVLQEATKWKEQEPVLKDALIYEFGEFIKNVPLFKLDGSGMTKIRMYIWMEGQDVDCHNYAMENDTSIVANIQFGTDEGAGAQNTGIVAR